MVQLINKTVLAIRQITTPRYFSSERGFVTEFYCQLKGQLENENLFPEHSILETEVQKRHSPHYGVTQRPDLLIHIPIETGLTNNSNENNFVVYAFKLNASRDKVEDDFAKLEEMFDRLNYQTGIFINIGSHPTSYLERYQGNFKNRIHEFSIGLVNGLVSINHSCFVENTVLTVVK